MRPPASPPTRSDSILQPVAEQLFFGAVKKVQVNSALAFLIVAMLGQISFAHDYYVNNVIGDDRNSGTVDSRIDSQSQQNGPFSTIARALKAARSGDRIFIQKTERPYQECLTVQGPHHSGTSLKKFHIISDGAILDGTRAVGDRWEFLGQDVYRFQPELKSHQQLFRDGKPIPMTRLGELERPFDLGVGEWTLREGNIYFRTDGKHALQYNFSYCFHSVGITLYQIHDVAIEGLVIQGFQLDGINAHDGVRRTVVLSNILRGNGRSGLSVGGASRVSVVACLIGDNGVAQLRTEGQSRTEIENCNLIESDKFGPPILQLGGRVANVDH